MDVLRRISENRVVDAKMLIADVVCDGDGFHLSGFCRLCRQTEHADLHGF
jgi:hypothetical protein